MLHSTVIIASSAGPTEKSSEYETSWKHAIILTVQFRAAISFQLNCHLTMMFSCTMMLDDSHVM